MARNFIEKIKRRIIQKLIANGWINNAIMNYIKKNETTLKIFQEECDHDYEDVCVENGDGIYHQVAWYRECKICGTIDECDESDYYDGDY